MGTTLDVVLRSRGIRTVVLTGISSNGCVDCTLRDAFQLEYYAIGVRDAAEVLICWGQT